MEGRIYNLYCEKCLDFRKHLVKQVKDGKQIITCLECKNQIAEIRLDSVTNLRNEVYEGCQREIPEEIKKKMNQIRNGS